VAALAWDKLEDYATTLLHGLGFQTIAKTALRNAVAIVSQKKKDWEEAEEEEEPEDV